MINVPWDETNVWFNEHEKKEEVKMEKLAFKELEKAFNAMDNKEINEDLSDLIQGNKIEIDNINASFTYSAGTMIAELLPDFKTPNKNGFYLDPSLKEEILKKLNSGKVFLKDAHGRAMRDILSLVKGGFEEKGKIYVKSDINPKDQPEIDSLLRKYKDKIGVSIGGPGVGFCKECNRRVIGMSRCPDHPKAPIVVKIFDLREVSLTDDPAWSTSKVKDYI